MALHRLIPWLQLAGEITISHPAFVGKKAKNNGRQVLNASSVVREGNGCADPLLSTRAPFTAKHTGTYIESSIGAEMRTCCRLLRLQRSSPRFKISDIPSDTRALTLPYTPRYAPLRKMALSSSLDVVNDKNRFLSLEILLDRLSGYAGGRQYRLLPNFSPTVNKLKSMGIDWHDLKTLDREELHGLLDDTLQMNMTDKAVLLTALEKKVCGVVCQDVSRHSTNVCLRRGLVEHGWRCGSDGHANDVYFEGKGPSHAPMQLAARHRSRTAAGVQTVVRDQPDFAVVGRNHSSVHPRIWRSPDNPQFLVDVIGYEFRVHPNDPRAATQIVDAAGAWELHAEVVQQVLWEMLEMYATERRPQPLQLEPGEMGVPDSTTSYSCAFNIPGPGADDAAASLIHQPDQDGRVDDGLRATAVEHKMRLPDGVEAPWFRAPLPQVFEHGVPQHLPFAPTVVVKSTFRAISRSVGAHEVEQHLFQPVMDVSVHVNPKACFSWHAEEEATCVEQILQYAKRLPFALPFYLYFRVDASQSIQRDPELAKRKQKLLEEKHEYFDLRREQSNRGRTLAAAHTIPLFHFAYVGSDVPVVPSSSPLLQCFTTPNRPTVLVLSPPTSNKFNCSRTSAEEVEHKRNQEPIRMKAPRSLRSRIRSRQQAARLTPEERERREQRRAKKKAIPAWLVWLMGLLVLGSTVIRTGAENQKRKKTSQHITISGVKVRGDNVCANTVTSHPATKDKQDVHSNASFEPLHKKKNKEIKEVLHTTMFAASFAALRSNFFFRTMIGGMSTNVKRPYRIPIRMEHDKKRRIKGRNIGCRRMMKSGLRAKKTNNHSSSVPRWVRAHQRGHQEIVFMPIFFSILTFILFMVLLLFQTFSTYTSPFRILSLSLFLFFFRLLTCLSIYREVAPFSRSLRIVTTGIHTHTRRILSTALHLG
eukprot:gene3712-2612_t